MDFMTISVKPKKSSSPLILTVLSAIPRNQLKQIPSPCGEFQLYQYNHKKITLAAYKIFIPKSKLLSNLQIYEWRCQTQFPIVKTLFVNVKQIQQSKSQSLELQAFNEYCPLKLTQIYEMSLGQCLYILKESLIGFQRLYNRFGGIEVLDNMIAVNEKGFCRVWLSENFALNTFPKKQISESRMISKIITIIQSHSQQSRASKKLFVSLKTCQSFLTSIKEIDKYVKQSKIMVPTRFNMVASSKQILKAQLQNSCRLIQEKSLPRLSVKQIELQKINNSIKQQLQKNSLKFRKRSCSPLQIKRFKSEDSICGADGTKISDGQTNYTGKNNKTSNIQISQNSAKQIILPERNLSYSHKKRPQWMEESSYVMGQQFQNAEKKTPKVRKQLSQSQAFKSFDSSSPSSSSPMSANRKYSCKITDNKRINYNPKNPYFSRKSVNQSYFTQFSNLLDRDQKCFQSPTKIDEVDEQEKLIELHTGTILKNNGWVPNVSGLLDFPTKLDESFHEGKQQNLPKKEIKLQKLNLLGRRQMQTSVLPDQLNELL